MAAGCVQSGCAACHRLRDFGNTGPGSNLTHVGSTLSTPQLERTLVDPRASMPSFSDLPAAKFKAVVEFLSLLR
jgi:mono/diheme cytochrome c family protein